MEAHVYFKVQEDCICSHFVALVERVEPQDVADTLYQLRVLTADQHEEVTSGGRPRRERVRRLLGLLPGRGHGLQGLVLALTRHPPHARLASSLWTTYRHKVQEVTGTGSGDAARGGETDPSGLSQGLDYAGDELHGAALANFDMNSLNLTISEERSSELQADQDKAAANSLDTIVDQEVKLSVNRHQAMQESLPSIAHQHLTATEYPSESSTRLPGPPPPRLSTAHSLPGRVSTRPLHTDSSVYDWGGQPSATTELERNTSGQHTQQYWNTNFEWFQPTAIITI